MLQTHFWENDFLVEFDLNFSRTNLTSGFQYPPVLIGTFYTKVVSREPLQTFGPYPKTLELALKCCALIAKLDQPRDLPFPCGLEAEAFL